MCPVISVSDEVYSKLESLAVGFDSPSNVIERLIYQLEEEGKPDLASKHDLLNKLSKERLYTNKEIQEKISNIAKGLSSEDLELLCNEQKSKEIFGISFPLFIRIKSNSSNDVMRKAVKAPDGVSRWTWKFSFEKDGYVYAVCTQWYAKNDQAVFNWLKKYK